VLTVGVALSASALEALSIADAAIDRASPERLSLDPRRARATTLAAILNTLADREPSPSPALLDALAIGLAEVATAQLRAFPSNLFWDFDFMAAAILDEVRDGASAPRIARTRLGLMAELQHLYGRETAIRFTYVHDFAYGYDWAKWIARDPQDRRLHGPYSATFLAYMHRRGHELLALIADDDRKYPTLVEEQPRNPFPFSREPASELRLHRDLARRREIPVEAWRVDAAPRWNRNYAAIRAERARMLGLCPPESSSDAAPRGNLP